MLWSFHLRLLSDGWIRDSGPCHGHPQRYSPLADAHRHALHDGLQHSIAYKHANGLGNAVKHPYRHAVSNQHADHYAVGVAFKYALAIAFGHCVVDVHANLQSLLHAHALHQCLRDDVTDAEHLHDGDGHRHAVRDGLAHAHRDTDDLDDRQHDHDALRHCLSLIHRLRDAVCDRLRDTDRDTGSDDHTVAQPLLLPLRRCVSVQDIDDDPDGDQDAHGHAHDVKDGLADQDHEQDGHCLAHACPHCVNYAIGVQDTL
mmetsp:Transcript_16809/g.65665  ORF Transcript_16809/g.65665 Transcript_16809/m.65665 type:complete len:258 (+) Transcript_16809:1313-2086(+)